MVPNVADFQNRVLAQLPLNTEVPTLNVTDSQIGIEIGHVVSVGDSQRKRWSSRRLARRQRGLAKRNRSNRSEVRREAIRINIERQCTALVGVPNRKSPSVLANAGNRVARPNASLPVSAGQPSQRLEVGLGDGVSQTDRRGVQGIRGK